MRRATARFAALAAGLLLALGAGACGGDDDDKASTVDSTPAPSGPPIRIGVKNFTEQTILGELYRQALVAKGYEVVLKPDVGSSEIIHRALQRGALDMYPEYIGVLLSEVAEERQRPRSAQAAYDAAQAFETPQRLQPARADAVLRRQRARGQAARTPSAMGCARSPTCGA